jgi:hypothetical protein
MGQTHFTHAKAGCSAAIHLLVLVVLLVGVGYAQSQDAPTLGDLARQQRQKQQDKAAKDAKDTKDTKDGKDAKAKKVFTNEEIPERPDLSPEATPSSSEGENTPDQSSAPVSMPSGHSAEEWKAAIQSQKALVDNLQQHIDKLSASIHFVEANRYTNGVQYNQRQAQKQEEVKRLQSQLDEQKQKLADMQEAARKAGFGNGVYDP